MNKKCGVTPEIIEFLNPNEIFVFGSNLSGMHGGGAAFTAYRKWGAEFGIGEGLTGQCYALPTMDYELNVLPIKYIYDRVNNLFATIRMHPDKTFLITKVACGIAGYSLREIAPLFKHFISVHNCTLPIEFIPLISLTLNN